MSDPSFLIRPMQPSEVELALQWAAEEGWNPGLQDALSFYQTDRAGFLVGLLNQEPIGCIAAVAYGSEFGFIGLYIVKPPYRGRGYGIQLWKAAIAHLGSVRRMGLDGVVAQQHNYAKSGFKWAYSHLRYEGRGGGVASSHLVNPEAIPFTAILAYDRAHFGAERADFLRSWFQQAGSTSLAVREDNRLQGYGTLRPCRTGYRIGPLFADNSLVAQDLLAGLIAHAPNAPIFIDVPEPNSQAIALVEQRQFQPVFRTARMYTPDPLPLPIAQIFGVTTLELG